MSSEELKKRKIEFLEKLKDLIDEYNVAIGVDLNGMTYIVTDGHEGESWDNETIVSQISKECIEEVLNILD